MTLTPLVASCSRAAEPRSAGGWRRSLQDPSRSALGRTSLNHPSRLALASCATDAAGA